MRITIAIIALALCALTGCDRQDVAQSDDGRRYPPPNPELMKFLKDMYVAHGAKAKLSGDWVDVDDGRLRTRVATFDHEPHPQSVLLQADFVSVLPSGESVVESF